MPGVTGNRNGRLINMYILSGAVPGCGFVFVAGASEKQDSTEDKKGKND